MTVWFYVAAGPPCWPDGARLAGRRVAGSADAYLALRLAHVHLNVLGWVGLAVVGTQFTLWPTVLRTRMVPGLERAVRWSLPPLAAAWRGRTGWPPGTSWWRWPAGAHAAGLAVALVRSSARPRRPPTTAAPGCSGRHGLAGGDGRGRPGGAGGQPQRRRP